MVIVGQMHFLFTVFYSNMIILTNLEKGGRHACPKEVAWRWERGIIPGLASYHGEKNLLVLEHMLIFMLSI